jgi:hypothetical protein
VARQAGKYGRLPFDPGRRRLILERYLRPRERMTAGGLPPVPLTEDVDRASEVAAWPMYLNDQLGDCTIAGMGHVYGALWQYGSGTEAMFTDDMIRRVYSRVGGYVPGEPDTDNGCNMQDVLADQHVHGIADVHGRRHKVAGYAALGNPQDLDLLGQVLSVFGTIYVGCNVQQQMEDEFGAGQPWTWDPAAATIGGHAICLQRRRGSGDAPLDYVTWGALQPATTGFQSGAVEEAWAVVSEDWVQKNGTTVTGLDLQQLLADMADV